MIAIAAVVNKFEKLEVCNKVRCDLKIVEIYLVPGKLVVKTKAFARVADLVNAFFQFDEICRAGFSGFFGCVSFAVGREERVYA